MYVFRFAAVCLVLRMAYLWISYLLTPMPDLAGSGELGRISELRLEGMLRSTVVTMICAVGLYLIAPFLGRVVTRGEEN